MIFAFYMNPEQRIKAFVELGHEIREIAQSETNNLNIRQQQLQELAANLYLNNAWFTPTNTLQALDGLARLLDESSLRGWLEQYPLEDDRDKTVGVVMAGNLPAVGFHDFMCVLLSGCRITAKLSSDDRLLIPAIAAMLVAIEPRFADRIHFTDGKMPPFEAIIATGSNNSARYFEYYFGKYPHIIRKSRTSIAILDGKETEADLKGLADDVFMYFGMGFLQILPDTYPFVWNVIYLPLASISIAFYMPFFSQLETTIGIIKKPIEFISKISYAIYLFHYSLILQLIMLFVDRENTSLIQFHMITAFYFTVLILISYVCYRFYETPIMDLRDKK